MAEVSSASETNKTVARRWFEEVWNQKNPEAILEMYHPQGRSRGLPDPGSHIVGPTEFQKTQKEFLTAFPDLQVTVDSLIGEGDWVAVRWTTRMTHMGRGFGFGPTGKTLTMHGSSFMHFEKGQIIEGFNQMDFTWLRQQMRQNG